MKNLVWLKVLSLISIIFSCDDKRTYLDGKIIKTSSDNISILKDEKIIKTTNVLENGYFNFVLDSIEDGLYNFQLNPEFQYIFLKKGDSLSLRLNTLDFDESLVFIGKGSSINNFLIDIFLKKEEEIEFLNKKINSKHDHFLKHVDSLIEENNNILSNFKKIQNTGSVENIVLENAQLMPLYSQLEIFYSLNNGKIDSLSKQSFFYFRDKVDFNLDVLSHFKPYLDYLILRSSNQEEFTTNDYPNKDLNFNISRLKFIESSIQNRKIKDKLIRHIAYEYLLKEKVLIDIENFLFEFMKISNNLEINSEINLLYNNIVLLQKGKKFPEICLINSNGKTLSSKALKNRKKTIYVFWSINQDSHKITLFNRIFKILNHNQRDYIFYCVNINSNQIEWIESLKTIPKSKNIIHFRSKEFDIMSKKIVLNNLNKIILTTGNGLILDISNIYEIEKKIKSD